MNFKEKKENPLDEQKLYEQVDAIFAELIKKPEISEALDLLNNLPSYLRYHDKNHTLDVLRETILFGLADNLDQKTLELQAIAAAWHDVGYLE